MLEAKRRVALAGMTAPTIRSRNRQTGTSFNDRPFHSCPNARFNHKLALQCLFREINLATVTALLIKRLAEGACWMIRGGP